MGRFVDLVAVEGPDRGMRFAIEEGTYRVLARAADDAASTLQMTPDGDRAFDAEQERRVQEFFASRPPSAARNAFRRRGADIVLKDSSVSRTHALVFVDKEGASVADLMSTNGTRVNGMTIKDVSVEPGDIVHLGKTKLRIEEG